MRATFVVMALLSIGAGCDRSATLVVDVRTDFDPGIEFDLVRVSVDGRSGPPEQHFVRSEDELLEPRRVAELDLSPGRHVVRVGLLSGGGRVVAERPVSVTVEGVMAITIVIARSCADVSCGGGGFACHGGRCVDDSCVTERPDSCGAPQCDVAADCPSGSPCAVPSCAGGVCLLGAGECPGGGLCSRTDGCGVLGTDAGPEDAGPDDAGPPAPFCGDMDCQSGESCDSCPGDCGACPFCGDGTCNGGESTCRDCESDCTHGHEERADTGESCSASEMGLYRCAMMNDGVCAGLMVSQLCATPTGRREWVIVSCMPGSCSSCFCEASFGCNP